MQILTNVGKGINKSIAEQQNEFKKMVKLAKHVECKVCKGKGYIRYDLSLSMYIPCPKLIHYARQIELNKNLEHAKN